MYRLFIFCFVLLSGCDGAQIADEDTRSWEEQRADELAALWARPDAVVPMESPGCGVSGDQNSQDLRAFTFIVDFNEACLIGVARRFTDRLNGRVIRTSGGKHVIAFCPRRCEVGHVPPPSAPGGMYAAKDPMITQIVLRLNPERTQVYAGVWVVLLRKTKGHDKTHASEPYFRYLGHSSGINPFGADAIGPAPRGCYN